MSDPFIFELSGGRMSYNHYRDEWSVTNDSYVQVAQIPASEYKTIREFKVAAQAILDRKAGN
jgi:hypothetical protein